MAFTKSMARVPRSGWMGIRPDARHAFPVANTTIPSASPQISHARLERPLGTQNDAVGSGDQDPSDGECDGQVRETSSNRIKNRIEEERNRCKKKECSGRDRNIESAGMINV